MLKKFQATTLRWFQSDKRKPVPSIDSGQTLSLIKGSAVQNRKWLGLSVIAFTLVVAGAVAQAQPTKVPRMGYLTGSASLFR